jgi:hypothetical protein
MMLLAAPIASARVQVAQAASAPQTVFQCEKAFSKGPARTKCIHSLPGSSCTHPLEAEKTEGYYRKDTGDFTVTLKETGEPGEMATQYWSWAPKPGVAICPYPNGAVYKVSLLSEREQCGQVHGEEVCSHEYDTKNLPEPTTAQGGHFTYLMTDKPIKSWYLLVRGYYIHPPWLRPQAQAAMVARSASALPKTVFQCKKAFKSGSSQRAACIKRVESQKPGTSCKYPLESGIATDSVAVGDTKEISVTEIVLSENPKSLPGPWIFKYEVTLINPRIVICSLEVDETVRTATGARENRVKHLTISPHGGVSSSVEVPETTAFFAVRAFGRYG